MTNTEKYWLQSRAYAARKLQIEAVSSAIIKLQIMGLTPENGMVECPCPEGIHPSRWTAMIKQGFKFFDLITKGKEL